MRPGIGRRTPVGRAERIVGPRPAAVEPVPVVLLCPRYKDSREIAALRHLVARQRLVGGGPLAGGRPPPQAEGLGHPADGGAPPPPTRRPPPEHPPPPRRRPPPRRPPLS